MKQKAVRMWIFRDYLDNFLAGFYLPHKVQLVCREESFEKAQKKALQYIKHFPDYIVSAVIEVTSFGEVMRNR